MHNVIFIVFGFLIILQIKSTCSNIQVADDSIKFVYANDESESIREKIRTDMENYKKYKEMALKTKSAKANPTKAPEKKVRPVDIDFPPEAEEIVEETTQVEETTTYIPSFEYQSIFSAPVICRPGQVNVNGRCRPLV